jgi:hypothetical protein
MQAEVRVRIQIVHIASRQPVGEHVRISRQILHLEVMAGQRGNKEKSSLVDTHDGFLEEPIQGTMISSHDEVSAQEKLPELSDDKLDTRRIVEHLVSAEFRLLVAAKISLLFLS